MLFITNSAAGVMERCLAVRNGANGTPGGDAQFYIADGSLAMTNVLAAYGRSGDAVCLAGGSLTMALCTLVTNGVGVTNAGWGVRGDTATPVIQNSIAWGNSLGGITNSTVTYSCSQEAQAGTGNVIIDPLFVDADTFHLQSRSGNYTNGFFSGGAWSQGSLSSPLIDAGNPLSARSMEPSPNGGRVNLGYDGNTPVASKSANPGSVFVIQ